MILLADVMQAFASSREGRLNPGLLAVCLGSRVLLQPEFAACAERVEESNGTVEAASIAYASPANQLATVLGLMEEAPVEFAPARHVSVAGVLLELALLSTTGLLEEVRGGYGRLKNSWYGLRATIWTLFSMALLRITRPEQRKGADPAGLGRVLGLPRAPEVKTIRRKLKELARRAKAAVFHHRLANFLSTWISFVPRDIRRP